jgi:hypothetical protein
MRELPSNKPVGLAGGQIKYGGGGQSYGVCGTVPELRGKAHLRWDGPRMKRENLDIGML